MSYLTTIPLTPQPAPVTALTLTHPHSHSNSNTKSSAGVCFLDFSVVYGPIQIDRIGKGVSMCPTKQKHRGSASKSAASRSTTTTTTTSTPDWITESINGGSLSNVDLNDGVNGWASPPGDLFSLRSDNYFTKRQKCPPGDYLLSAAGMDWLKSSTKLDNVLARPDNRVSIALKKAQEQGHSLKSFIFAVNLQVPGKDQHSAVFYFGAEDPIPPGSLLYRFVNGDDAFRNQRFKIVNRIVKGPWMVKKAVGSYSACLLGKALTCNYHRGENYLEIDVDIASSKIATAILHVALGCVTSVTIDMGFVVEAQEEDELPEKLIGAIRVCQMEMSSAAVIDAPSTTTTTAVRGNGSAKVKHHGSGDAGDD